MKNFIKKTFPLSVLTAMSCSQAYDVVKDQKQSITGLPPVTPVSVTENFHSSPNGSSLDMLFVIDNSGSMEQEQTNLSLSFDALIQDMQTVDLSYQIGVISTDPSRPDSTPLGVTPWNNDSYLNITNLGSGSLLARGSNEKVLTKDTPNLVTKFKENVNIGITINRDVTGFEMAIQSLIHAFSPELSGTGAWNAPLFRDDALLSIIIVSDEDETLSIGDYNSYLHQNPSEKAKRFAAFDKAALALKKNRRGLVRVDSIISDPENTCSTSPKTGHAYAELTNIYGGKVFSICNEFSGILEELGGALTNQSISSFALEKKPQSVSSVKLNGQTLVLNVGYTVNANNNTITLIGDALTTVSTTHALVEVTYLTIEGVD